MTYRIIQWFTGSIAQHQIALCHAHPEIELVGALVFHEDKEGRDVGEIAGIGPIGVKATRDRDALLALDADCVLYNPPSTRYEDIPLILSAGKNVVSACSGFYPQTYPEVAKELEAACLLGGSSLIGAGLSPSGALDVLALAGASVFTAGVRFERIHMRVGANIAGYATHAPHLLTETMGFGKPPEELRSRKDYSAAVVECYRETIQMLADVLEVPIERFEVGLKIARARHECAEGLVKPGTAAGISHTIAGILPDGRQIIHESTWWVSDELHDELDYDWSCAANEDVEWTVDIRGDFDFRFNAVIEDHHGTAKSTATRIVNAIPLVCEAPPGLCTLLNTPMPRPWTGGVA